MNTQEKKPYRLVVSYDIVDDEGDSLIEDNYVNACSIRITELECNSLIYHTAISRLAYFVHHLYAGCHQVLAKTHPAEALPVSGNTYELESVQNYIKVKLGHWSSKVNLLGKAYPHKYREADMSLTRALVREHLSFDNIRSSEHNAHSKNAHRCPSEDKGGK